MKASELRIGNFVFGVEQGYKETALPIACLHNDDTVRLQVGNDTIGCYSSKIINPIPLTEEWLFKFWFEAFKKFKPGTLEKTGETEFITFIPRLGMALYYSKYPWENEYHYAVLKNMTKEHIAILKYVHQLQNLYFALTGEELTITE